MRSLLPQQEERYRLEFDHGADMRALCVPIGQLVARADYDVWPQTGDIYTSAAMPLGRMAHSTHLIPSTQMPGRQTHEADLAGHRELPWRPGAVCPAR